MRKPNVLFINFLVMIFLISTLTLPIKPGMASSGHLSAPLAQPDEPQIPQPNRGALEAGGNPVLVDHVDQLPLYFI